MCSDFQQGWVDDFDRPLSVLERKKGIYAPSRWSGLNADGSSRLDGRCNLKRPNDKSRRPPVQKVDSQPGRQSPNRPRPDEVPSVSPEAVGDLGNTTHHPLSGPPPSQLASALSAQERLIISLIVVGYTNRAIANYLSLSESTIHRRIVRIFATLGVSDKFELVLFAVDRGIIEDLPDDTDESS